MITIVSPISSLNSGLLQTSDGIFYLKQFSRNYPGNYNINFVKCLSAINDAKTKNYTNFYLTNDYKYSEITNVDNTNTKSLYIYGPLINGTDFLKFNEIDPRPYARANRLQEAENYGIGIFSSDYDSLCDFTIILNSNNKCEIYYTKNYKKYYLCSDIDNQLVFIKEHLLQFDTDYIQPQDFSYVYSDDFNNIFLYKKTPDGEYSVVNYSNRLKLNSLLDGDLISNTQTPFKLSKSIYNNEQRVPDNSFITYNGNNNIDITKSEMSLSNNLLLHKQFMDSDTPIDIIVLKNNLLDNGVFSSANNLLSGGSTSIYVDGLREYNNIIQNIDEETSESLDINYVFYNTPYTIKSGDNLFYSPSSMYPFTCLNINDTKFVENGAFGYNTPEYADKVYHLSKNVTLNENNQHLLCTWLSGSHASGDKVWVDRYYYPDLINKRDALSGISELSTTYDSYIESLIYGNSNIYDSCNLKKFFDKKSDLIFTPSNQYLYSRTDYSDQSFISPINETSIVNNINYFRDINNSGEFTLSFTFLCDNSNWSIESDRNDINSGLTISKTDHELSINYNIYDSTNYEYDTTEYSWIRHSKIVTLNPSTTNHVSIGVDSKTKTSYFFVNNVLVYEFKLPTYQLYIKQLLYGDFHLIEGSTKTKINSSGAISNVFISNKYYTYEIMNIFNGLRYVGKLDDIYISLPCGMSNGLDSVEILNSICGSSTFKSNFININVKNLNISDVNILNGLSDSIKNNLKNILPSNSTLNNINFNNYK